MGKKAAQTIHLELSPNETEDLGQLIHIPAALPSVGDLCKTYNEYKSLVTIAENLVGKIPVYGNKIETLLKILTGIADMACPVAQDHASPGVLSAVGGSSPGTVLNAINLPGRFASEDSDYSSFKVSNGYGMLSKVGIQVQKGVTATATVNFEMESVAEQTFKTWLQDSQSYFSNEEWHTLEENYAAGGFLGGVLLGCFGLLFGGGTYNHYKNSHDKQVTVNNQKNQGFVKSLHNLTKTKVQVTGSISATGTSIMPVEGFVFVETTSIEFKDGTSLTVINSSNPVVAQQDGNTQGLSTSSGQSLNIVPIKS